MQGAAIFMQRKGEQSGGREEEEREADNRSVDSQWRLTALKRAALAAAGRVAAW